MRIDCCEFVLECSQYTSHIKMYFSSLLCELAILAQKAPFDSFDVVGRRLRSNRRLIQARHERWIGMQRLKIECDACARAALRRSRTCVVRCFRLVFVIVEKLRALFT